MCAYKQMHDSMWISLYFECVIDVRFSGIVKTAQVCSVHFNGNSSEWIQSVIDTQAFRMQISVWSEPVSVRLLQIPLIAKFSFSSICIVVFDWTQLDWTQFDFFGSVIV